MIGAGNFGRLVMLPHLKSIKGVKFRGICTAKGLSASHVANKYGFEYATADAEEVFSDKDTDAVLILTRHDLHADLVSGALGAGKHVFVEKPLCITSSDLTRLSEEVDSLPASAPTLLVGFNRRFSPALSHIKGHFEDVAPLSVSYRFVSPTLSSETWQQDMEVGGGRIIGEACHAVDFCIAVTESPAVKVFAESVRPVGSLKTPDDRVFITVRHANGSVSNVSYQASGDPVGPREHVEVFGGGRSAIVDDWGRVELWKAGHRRIIALGKNKGHAAELRALLARADPEDRGLFLGNNFIVPTGSV